MNKAEEGHLETCEHCGLPEDPEQEWLHRGCRMKAAFPGAYSQEGALTTFDMAKLRDSLGYGRPFTTRPGVTFERWHDGGLWISVTIQVGNSLSSWSWTLSSTEWDAVVAAMAQIPKKKI